MDLLTREELEAIATPTGSGPHVSLFMPTQRVSTDTDADRLQWKNLVAGVEAILLRSMRRPDVDALLKPARDLHDDALTWQYMSDGLAMFLTPEGHSEHRVAAPVVPLATVGDRHVLGPLVRLLSGDEHFLVLALSQQKVRLLSGSRHTVEEVQLEDVPTSLTDVVDPKEPRSDAMARPAGGRAVFYGHGAGDDHFKQDEVNRFLRQVAQGVRELLADQTSPLVLVGLENLVHSYKDSNGYGHLVDEFVSHNADDLDDAKLHELAWPIVEKRLREQRATVFERFTELDGTGKVSSDLETVLEAADQGKVETLFVRADPWAWERAGDQSAPVVELGSDETYAIAEKVDAAAVATLTKGGRVFATSQTTVPGREVAAIFRY